MGQGELRCEGCTALVAWCFCDEEDKSMSEEKCYVVKDDDGEYWPTVSLGDVTRERPLERLTYAEACILALKANQNYYDATGRFVNAKPVKIKRRAPRAPKDIFMVVADLTFESVIKQPYQDESIAEEEAAKLNRGRVVHYRRVSER